MLSLSYIQSDAVEIASQPFHADFVFILVKDEAWLWGPHVWEFGWGCPNRDTNILKFSTISGQREIQRRIVRLNLTLGEEE